MLSNQARQPQSAVTVAAVAGHLDHVEPANELAEGDDGAGGRRRATVPQRLLRHDTQRRGGRGLSSPFWVLPFAGGAAPAGGLPGNGKTSAGQSVWHGLALEIICGREDSIHRKMWVVAIICGLGGRKRGKIRHPQGERTVEHARATPYHISWLR